MERQPALRDLVTIVFDDEDEYVRFTDYVYNEFLEGGLELTNAPITTSIRLTQALWDKTHEQFQMRPITEEDLIKARARVAGHRPFDPETIRDLHVPGVASKGRVL